MLARSSVPVKVTTSHPFSSSTAPQGIHHSSSSNRIMGQTRDLSVTPQSEWVSIRTSTFLPNLFPSFFLLSFFQPPQRVSYRHSDQLTALEQLSNYLYPLPLPFTQDKQTTNSTTQTRGQLFFQLRVETSFSPFFSFLFVRVAL